MCVALSTQAISEEASHGPDLRYLVTINSSRAHPASQRRSQSPLPKTNSTYAILSLKDHDIGQGSVVHVQAVNKAGLGPSVALHLGPRLGQFADCVCVGGWGVGRVFVCLLVLVFVCLVFFV